MWINCVTSSTIVLHIFYRKIMPVEIGTVAVLDPQHLAVNDTFPLNGELVTVASIHNERVVLRIATPRERFVYQMKRMADNGDNIKFLIWLAIAICIIIAIFGCFAYLWTYL